MLTDIEIGKYRAFGFTVVRGCLSAGELRQFNEAYERLMAKARVFNYFGTAGTKQLDNPHLEDLTIASLAVHPGVLDAMRALWGRPWMFAASSDMWWNLDETPWHSDTACGLHAPSLQVAWYLDETTAEQGSLRVIPGTHQPEFNRALFANCGCYDEGRGRLRLDPAEVPAVAIQTRPGDAVIFDNRMYHSALKRKDGRGRRNLFFQYARDPGDDLEALGLLRLAVSTRTGDKRPYFYSAELMAHKLPALRSMAERLRELGIPNPCPPEFLAQSQS